MRSSLVSSGKKRKKKCRNISSAVSFFFPVLRRRLRLLLLLLLLLLPPLLCCVALGPLLLFCVYYVCIGLFSSPVAGFLLLLACSAPLFLLLLACSAPLFYIKPTNTSSHTNITRTFLSHGQSLLTRSMARSMGSQTQTSLIHPPIGSQTKTSSSIFRPIHPTITKDDQSLPDPSSTPPSDHELINPSKLLVG